MNSNDSNKGDLSRRAAIAVGLAPLIVPRHVLGGVGFQAPSDKLRIAAVGVAGMGRNYIHECADEAIVGGGVETGAGGNALGPGGTGATFAACSEALNNAGAKYIYALTLARALPHHGLQIV